jgi:predicted small lipoprotein YifL
MIRFFILLCVGLGLLAPLAACGKKGPPTLPPGETDQYPRKYPND